MFRLLDELWLLSGMAQLREESDARLLMHEADRERVENGDYDRTSAFIYGEPFPPVKVDGLLRDGDVLQVNGFNFAVLHTPGHTEGSICLWTDEAGLKILIAGDTIWGATIRAFALISTPGLGRWTACLDSTSTF